MSTPETTSPELNVIMIPASHYDQVREFAAGLEREDAEVAGFATGRAATGGPISGTSCKTTKGLTGDFTCTDSDVVSTGPIQTL